MSIKSGNTLIPMMGADGFVVAYRLVRSPRASTPAFVGMASDGKVVALKIAAMSKRDQTGPIAMAADSAAVALRNGLVLEMIMIFTDLAHSVYWPNGYASWDADMVRWGSLVAAHGPPDFAAVYTVAGYPGYDIIPPDRDYPAEISHSAISRYPSTAEVISAYNWCKGGEDVRHPRRVIICFGATTTMNRHSLEPGLTGFEQWLNDGGTFTPDPATPLPRIAWREVAIHTRWLDYVSNLYEDFG